MASAARLAAALAALILAAQRPAAAVIAGTAQAASAPSASAQEPSPGSHEPSKSLSALAFDSELQGLQGAIPSASGTVISALARATDAAKIAWALQKDVEAQSTQNLEYVPLVEAEVALAKTAAQTAAEQDEEATKLLNETQNAARAAANSAVQAYFQEVQAAAANASAQAAALTAEAESQAEVRAAEAASEAAMPYHAMLLRGQKVVVDYQKRAQALAVVSNSLKAEGAQLAGSANQYQALGQAAQANQIMLTAHALFHQGEMMKKEAEQLHASAVEVSDALPAYQAAEQAAADSAAAAANPPELPAELPPY